MSSTTYEEKWRYQKQEFITDSEDKFTPKNNTTTITKLLQNIHSFTAEFCSFLSKSFFTTKIFDFEDENEHLYKMTKSCVRNLKFLEVTFTTPQNPQFKTKFCQFLSKCCNFFFN